MTGGSKPYIISFSSHCLPGASESLGDVAERSKALPC
ncbi:hypothetical protein EMIT0158MI4_30498 [Burkholderia ambifaria]